MTTFVLNLLECLLYGRQGEKSVLPFTNYIIFVCVAKFFKLNLLNYSNSELSFCNGYYYCRKPYYHAISTDMKCVNVSFFVANLSKNLSFLWIQINFVLSFYSFAFYYAAFHLKKQKQSFWNKWQNKYAIQLECYFIKKVFFTAKKKENWNKVLRLFGWLLQQKL